MLNRLTVCGPSAVSTEPMFVDVEKLKLGGLVTVNFSTVDEPAPT
jgi:hypothetical protein